jgi:protein-tyrosine kinase
MDRIRKALDLARQERAQPATISTGTGTAAAVLRPVSSISYTRTRVFSPSPELLENNRIIGADDQHAATSAYRMLRTQVLMRLEENKWSSLAVMSPRVKDGKTTTAINLAISAANDHRYTVLLVDFDLKNPTIGANFGLSPEKGVDDVLRGEAAVEDCLYHPQGFERLVILPARAPMRNSSEALVSSRCRNLVAELKSRYRGRILIFDLPPILAADDALAFAQSIDCGLLVVAEGSTGRNEVVRSFELLRHVPIVGTVLNRASHVRSSQG